MTIAIKWWLISIPAWAALVALHQAWGEKTRKARRKIKFAAGEIFAGSGGVGALLSINSSTDESEVTLRLFVAGVLIVFGVILIMLNAEEE